jgi:hypothetical protein
MGSKGGVDAWSRVHELASRLAPPDEWRSGLAHAVQRAGSLAFCTVLTCPPNDGYRFAQNSTSEPYDRLLAVIRHRFLREIEAVGEGWRYGLQRFGPVYTPLEVARAEHISGPMRSMLREADIDGYLASFIVDGDRRLLGMLITGGPRRAKVLMDGYRNELARAKPLAAYPLLGIVRQGEGAHDAGEWGAQTTPSAAGRARRADGGGVRPRASGSGRPGSYPGRPALPLLSRAPFAAWSARRSCARRRVDSGGAGSTPEAENTA